VKKNPRKFRLFVDTVRGPWFSVGVHLDFQAPKIDIHFWWWIISVGWLYMSDAAEHSMEPT